MHALEIREVARRFSLDEVQRRLPRHELALRAIGERCRHAFDRRCALAGGRLEGLSGRLESVSYAGVLQRGFALVRGPEGRLVKRAETARDAERLELEFADGRVPVVPGERPRRRPERRDATAVERQGSLL